MTKDRLNRFIDNLMVDVTILAMILALAIAVLWPNIVYTIPAGHIGVVWLRFGGGTVTDREGLRGEGISLIFPWDKLFIYDARMQYITESYNAISSDGMELQAQVSVRFRLNRHLIGLLHQQIGPDYVNNLLLPEIGSHARTLIAQFSAEQVYSTQRDTIQTSLIDYVNGRLLSDPDLGGNETFLVVNTVLIRGIQLPPTIVAAINRKIEQFYANQEYDFRLLREAKEAQRREIEGTGIQRFQQIVSQGISDSYLRWRGIEATLQLAQSQNAKIVIIGGADGLPLILNMPNEPANAAASGAGLAIAAPPAAQGAGTADSQPPTASGVSFSGPSLPGTPGAGAADSQPPNLPGMGITSLPSARSLSGTTGPAAAGATDASPSGQGAPPPPAGGQPQPAGRAP